MKKTFLNFTPTVISIILPVIAVNTFDIYIGLIIGVIGIICVYLLNQKINIQRKKEAIPEILAIGYYLNFIEPLSGRIRSNTRILNEDEAKEMIFSSDDINVNIFKADLKQLPKVKEEMNKLSNFSIKDDNNDKSFSVRGQVDGTKLNIFDFPNTLFSLQDYFISEFGDNISMKEEYTERFYRKIETLKDNNILKGRVELSKIELITPLKT